MAFATKKDATNWANYHLKPTKYGNYYDPIDSTETRPVKRAEGCWGFELRDDCWIDNIERMKEACRFGGIETPSCSRES